MEININYAKIKVRYDKGSGDFMSNSFKVEQTKKMLRDIDVKCLRKSSLEEDRILFEKLNHIIELTIKKMIYFYGISESDYSKTLETDIEAKKTEINEQIQTIYDSKKKDVNALYSQEEKNKLIELRTQIMRLEEHKKKIETIFSVKNLLEGNIKPEYSEINHNYLVIDKEQSESFEELEKKCLEIIQKIPGFSSTKIDNQIDFVYDYYHDHKLHAETASYHQRLEKLHFYEEEKATHKEAAALLMLVKNHIDDIVKFMRLYNSTDDEKKNREIKSKESEIKYLTANPLLGIINKKEKMRIETEIDNTNKKHDQDKCELEKIEKQLEEVGLKKFVEAYKEIKSKPNVYPETSAVMVAKYIKKYVQSPEFDILKEIQTHLDKAQVAEIHRVKAEKVINEYKIKNFGVKLTAADHPLMQKTFEEIDKLEKLRDLNLEGVSPIVCIYIKKVLDNIKTMNIEDIIESTNFEKEKVSMMSADCTEMIDSAVKKIQNQIYIDLKTSEEIIPYARPSVTKGISR